MLEKEIMNTHKARLLSFVRRVNLGTLLFEELEDRSSPLVDFINSFTLNHITSNLQPSKRQEFVVLLERENDEDKIWQFVKENIKDFEKNYEEKLEKKLQTIKQQVLSSKQQK